MSYRQAADSGAGSMIPLSISRRRFWISSSCTMRGRLAAARQRRFQMNHTSRQLQDFAPLKFLIQSQSPILPVLRRLNRRRFPSKATNLPFDNGSRKAPFPVVDHPDAVARRRLRIAKRGILRPLRTIGLRSRTRKIHRLTQLTSFGLAGLTSDFGRTPSRRATSV